jgi:hypothetical protein
MEEGVQIEEAVLEMASDSRQLELLMAEKLLKGRELSMQETQLTGQKGSLMEQFP